MSGDVKQSTIDKQAERYVRKGIEKDSEAAHRRAVRVAQEAERKNTIKKRDK